MMYPSFTKITVTLVSAALVVSGCSSGKGTSTQSTTAVAASTVTSAAEEGSSTTATSGAASSTNSKAAFPMTINDVTIEKKPDRIVSLSPTATEDLFAIGAGNQVVAADSYSTYPKDAPKTDLSGFKPNVEAIMTYKPDLVVASNDSNDMVAGLAKLGVPTLIMPAASTIDDAYTQIEQLGAVTGHIGDAAELVLNMQTRIKAAVDKVGDKAQGVTYYHEVDPTFYTITNKTFLGNVYSLFGMNSIIEHSDTPYPQVNQETIIEDNPQVIFLADTSPGGVTVEQVKARPGWDSIAAVKNNKVVALDNDIASRWGPRIPDLVESLVPTLTSLPAPVSK